MKKQRKQELREMDLGKLMKELEVAKKQLAEARLATQVGRHKGQPVNLLADNVAVIKTIISEKSK